MEALPAIGKRMVFWGRVGTLLCVAAAAMFVQEEIGGLAPVQCVRRAGLNLAANFTVLTQPDRYLRDRTEAFRAEQKRDQLPRTRATIGRAAADIFGQGQAVGLFNDFNYRPRPVFQSYAAYSRSLMELNGQFYLSKDAPEYVLFNLHALDGRYPPLEDAFVLRELLINYKLLFSEGDFLLLRRENTAGLQMTLIKEGTAGSDEKIDLPGQRDSYLWLEIEWPPAFLDRLREFFYKPRETQLILWSRSAESPPARFRAPAAMLSAGFLASPLVLDNQDAGNLYTGGDIHAAGAFSVQTAPGWPGSCPQQIHFRIYRIQRVRAE